MKFVTEHFRRYDALLLAVAAAVIILYTGSAPAGFPLDDSWIHQVYGRNLAQTGQWAFVPGVPSAASTAPLYTVLLAIGYVLNAPYLLWTHSLGTAALWVAGVLSGRMAERLMPGQRTVALLSGLTVILAWHLIWAAASGMETMLFSMWTLALVTLAWRELDDRPQTTRAAGLRGVVFGALAALATLTRPEGVALAGMIGLLMLIVRPQRSGLGCVRWAVGAGLGFGLVIAPYLTYNLSLTGGLLPDTAAAKQAENAPLLEVSYPGRVVNMLFPLIAGIQLFLLPGMIAFASQRIRHDPSPLFYLLPLLWGVGLIALYAARLPAPYQHGRYVIPSLPGTIVVGVVGTIWLIERYRHSLIGRVFTRALAISAFIAGVYFALLEGVRVYRQDVLIINEEMVAAANWIAATIPPEDLLAVHDIGAVGYFAPRPILDLAGLVSPEIVPFILEEEPLWNWMRERGARYLMAFPDQIPGKDASDSRLCPLFTTGGTTSPAAGGPNMTVYALTWNDLCPPGPN